MKHSGTVAIKEKGEMIRRNGLVNTDLANLRRKAACGSLHGSALRRMPQLSPAALLRRLHRIRPMCTDPAGGAASPATRRLWTEGPAPEDSEGAASSGAAPRRASMSCMKQDLLPVIQMDGSRWGSPAYWEAWACGPRALAPAGTWGKGGLGASNKGDGAQTSRPSTAGSCRRSAGQSRVLSPDKGDRGDIREVVPREGTSRLGKGLKR